MTRAGARLGLGTVQFGQAYGVSNARGRVPAGEVARILALAAEHGVGVLDTAAGYGDAEQVLGQLATAPFRIITKTIGIGNGVAAVLERARQSSVVLGRKPVDALLVHSAADLKSPDGAELWNGLQRLKDEGWFRKIGFSAYVDDDPAALARALRPDIVQVPASLLDQRLAQSGALRLLRELGVEVHARSIFLQGLLFLAEDALPPRLRHAAGSLARVRDQLAEHGLTPLEGALACALSRPEIDVALVGVTARTELSEILSAAAKTAASIDWARCALDDALVLTPSRW